MATKYECDRCNTQFHTRKTLRTIDLSLSDGKGYTEENSTYPYDLCFTCFKGLEDYVKYKRSKVEINPPELG